MCMAQGGEDFAYGRVAQTGAGGPLGKDIFYLSSFIFQPSFFVGLRYVDIPGDESSIVHKSKESRLLWNKLRVVDLRVVGIMLIELVLSLVTDATRACGNRLK